MRKGSLLCIFIFLATRGQRKVLGLWICNSIMRLFTLTKGQTILVIISNSTRRVSYGSTLFSSMVPQRSFTLLRLGNSLGTSNKHYGSGSNLIELLDVSVNWGCLCGSCLCFLWIKLWMMWLSPTDMPAMPINLRAFHGDKVPYAITKPLLLNQYNL